MKHIRFVVLLSAIVAAPVTLADRDSRGPDVAPVTNKLYQQECGSCHMAYQPGLLPARSWETTMRGLASHFGDNAELGAEERQAISEYLTANAADRAREKRARKIADSLGRVEAPPRITDTPYIRRKHDEIPVRLVKDNPNVKSLAQCNVCHTHAERGSYRESEINIPGYGRWKD
jgi:hypothetical protein